VSSPPVSADVSFFSAKSSLMGGFQSHRRHVHVPAQTEKSAGARSTGREFRISEARARMEEDTYPLKCFLQSQT